MQRRSILFRSAIVVSVLIGIFTLLTLHRLSIDHPRPSARTVGIPDEIRQKFAKSPGIPEPIATANHGSSIDTVAFSPTDPSLIVSVSKIGRAARTIKLWDLNNTSEPVAVLGGHSFAFSPDGEFLALTGWSRGTRLWHIDEQKSINTFGRMSYDPIAFSPDGQWIASSELGVKLWNIRTPTTIVEGPALSHEGLTDQFTFSPDSNLLAAIGGINDNVTIWNIESQQTIKTIKSDAQQIKAIAFSPDIENPLFAIADDNRNIKLYTVPDWHLHTTISASYVYDLAFMPDRKTLVSTGINEVEFWSIENGTRIAASKKHESWSNSLTLSTDGTKLASGDNVGILRVWNTSAYLDPQKPISKDTVQIIYFLPSDRTAQPNIPEKLDKLIKEVQQFYAEQMEHHGFKRKTFTFAKNEDGSAKIYLVEGQYTDAYYLKETPKKVDHEIYERFDESKNVHLIIADVSSNRINNRREDVSGVGRLASYAFEYEENLWRSRAGRAMIPASGSGFDSDTIAHELGHAFGLQHDFRDASYLMSYGRASERLSQASAEWLDKSRFFNPGQTFFDEPTTIEIVPFARSLSESTVLQFHLTDADGLHQAMLLIRPTTDTPPPGYQMGKNPGENRKYWRTEQKEKSFVLHDYRSLNAQKEATVKFNLPEPSHDSVKLQMIDVHGNITFRTFNLKKIK